MTTAHTAATAAPAHTARTVGIVTGAGRGMGEACARRLADTVDVLLLVDRDEAGVTAVADDLNASTARAVAQPFALDVTDRDGLAGLAARVAELGTLRAVAHAAGISPTMADWRRIFEVDLIGTALLAEALRPLATAGTAHVYFSSMSPLLAGVAPGPAVAEILDDPLQEDFLDKIREAVGPGIEESTLAYPWAKHGVARFARKEAVRLGPVGGRVCSLAPGIIDTPQGRQEAARHASMQKLVDATPLGRTGTSEEVASVVAFILSDEASFLNGIDVLVDGGVCAAVGGR
ncbi:SDR family oxidoreductase [Streptomyces sp. NBC_01235]|uniref:SDR family oxidoreductase n=1 Tax=Streptomyces sp. NBC_01235 TaxID=2903788 RepID=UPI002E0FCC98|nr:SDR family oxidoreductase [Streptomyces sp. NBC_01235]